MATKYAHLDRAGLEYTRKDLREVIDIWEQARREGTGINPKLGQYWDEYYEVCGRLRDMDRKEREAEAARYVDQAGFYQEVC